MLPASSAGGLLAQKRNVVCRLLRVRLDEVGFLPPLK